jgi:formiminotetrahydrofolate cyclodeaminase
VTEQPLRRRTVEGLCTSLGAPAPEPSGGSASAVAAAMAASLVGLVARASTDWAEAPGVAAQAGVLRERLLELADADAAAYADALAELRAPAPAGVPRDAVIGRALARAADAPLEIAEVAADVAELARLAEAEGRADVRPDATVARELAAAAARSAARLVEVNLVTLPGDARSVRAVRAAQAVGGS